MSYLPQTHTEAAALNLAYLNCMTIWIQGKLMRVVGMTRGIPVRYLLEPVEGMTSPRLKSVQEMRQAAEQAIGTVLSAERLEVRCRIEQAAKNGLTSVTYYEPISQAMVRELAELGYNVKAESGQGRNETNWNVQISW